MTLLLGFTNFLAWLHALVTSGLIQWSVVILLLLE